VPLGSRGLAFAGDKPMGSVDGAVRHRVRNVLVDRSEIDALLAEAEGLVGEVAPVAKAPEQPQSTPANVAKVTATEPDLARILRIRVPVIVQLARRRMPIAALRDMAVGAILEFDKSVDDPLELLINNQMIAHGHCVKVAENFGLRITAICDKAQRIRSMGKQ